MELLASPRWEDWKYEYRYKNKYSFLGKGTSSVSRSLSSLGISFSEECLFMTSIGGMAGTNRSKLEEVTEPFTSTRRFIETLYGTPNTGSLLTAPFRSISESVEMVIEDQSTAMCNARSESILLSCRSVEQHGDDTI